MSDNSTHIPQVILASGSATRAKLLRSAGIALQIDPPMVDEDSIKAAFQAEAKTAHELAEVLADLKAQRISPRHPHALVVGADQVLVCEDILFNKPETLSEARDQLLALRGKTHELITCAVVLLDDHRIWHKTDTAKLTMRNFTEAFLDDYLADMGDLALSSVGAYQLEGLGGQLFTEVKGDYFTILGLPLLPLMDVFRNYGVVTP